MAHRSAVGVAAAFQHVLYLIYAPTRAIALGAEQHIGRARCQTKSAMDAGSEDALGLGDFRLGQLDDIKLGLHDAPNS